MGLSGPELWNNIGLSCFYANQHDMALGCLVRAVGLAGDDTSADVWYNIGQVGLNFYAPTVVSY
jgi:tetratricopeptide repeat protein 8